MRPINFDTSNLITALWITLMAALVSISMLFFAFDVSLNTIRWGWLMLLVVLVFLFTYLILIFRFEHFVVKRVKALYHNLFPTTFTSGISTRSTDIDLLIGNIKKLNADKNSEIELLRTQENYRREFIGNIAHELKTPLFTIQGYVLTLLDGKVKDQKIIKKYLKQTAKGVNRLTYVINDLDLITKFESGMASLERSPFDIRKTVENVFGLLEMQAQKDNITLRFDKKYTEPILIFADKERIHQVLTNLIINSLKYGIERGSTEVGFVILKEGKVLVKISDNGEGIAPEHLPRLFERFYRVDKTRNRSHGGSGLGLAIVKHIIEAHNEKIFVESEQKVGSEFSFSLPIATPQQLEVKA